MNINQLFSNPAYAGLLADEDQSKLQNQALLNAGLTMLASAQGGQPGFGKAGLFPGILQGLQAGQQAYTGGAEGILKNQQIKQQRDVMAQRKQLLGGLTGAPNALQSALAGGGGPTVANAEKMQGVQGNNLARMMDAYREALLLDDGGKTAEQIKGLIEAEKPKLTKLGKGEQLIEEGTGKVVAQGAEDLPSAVREYQFAVGQGYKGSFNDFQTQQKRAGATNIQMPSIKIGNTFGEDVAKSVAGIVMGQVDAATAAADTVNTVQNMRQALPKAIVGTGANARIALARLGQTIGISGKDEAETLAATSQIIQGLAKTQLNVAQSNKGQGTFTDFERKLLAQAASGDIDMSTAELNTLFNAVEKGARKQYQIGKQQAGKVQTNPMFEQIAPFISIPDLPAEQEKQTANRKRYNPATGMIE